MRSWLHRLLLIAALLAGPGLFAAERIPPAPPQYFNDYAGVVSPAVANELNSRLEQYERDSSNQLLVAIYPTMESNSSVEDYTVRVAQAWKVGQQGRNNGAVLFAFMQEHKLYIQVGYGLEPVLTDAIASQIVQDELKPAFRAGDYDGGMRSAVKSMIAATKGEFRGTGRTQAHRNPTQGIPPKLILFVIFALVSLAHYFWIRRQGGATFSNPRLRGSGRIRCMPIENTNPDRLHHVKYRPAVFPPNQPPLVPPTRRRRTGGRNF